MGSPRASEPEPEEGRLCASSAGPVCATAGRALTNDRGRADSTPKFTLAYGHLGRTPGDRFS